MDTKDLKCFLQVCVDGSLTKAAKALYITPQGLSKIIINLERELNSQLFYRTSSGLKITEVGVILKEKARHIISELEEIKDYDSLIKNISGEIHLASSYGVIAAFSPNFLFDFNEEHPKIDLKWWEYSDYRAEDAIWNGDADCGLIKGPIDNERFDSKLLASYKPIILVPNDHHLSRRKSIAVSDLAKEDIILENKEFKIYHNFQSACKKAGFIPNIVFQTTEISLAHRLCQQGLGLAISVDFAIEDMAYEEIRAIPFLDEDVKWEVYFVTRRSSFRSPTIKIFQEYMEHYLLD